MEDAILPIEPKIRSSTEDELDTSQEKLLALYDRVNDAIDDTSDPLHDVFSDALEWYQTQKSKTPLSISRDCQPVAAKRKGQDNPNPPSKRSNRGDIPDDDWQKTLLITLQVIQRLGGGYSFKVGPKTKSSKPRDLAFERREPADNAQVQSLVKLALKSVPLEDVIGQLSDDNLRLYTHLIPGLEPEKTFGDDEYMWNVNATSFQEWRMWKISQERLDSRKTDPVKLVFEKNTRSLWKPNAKEFFWKEFDNSDRLKIDKQATHIDTVVNVDYLRDTHGYNVPKKFAFTYRNKAYPREFAEPGGKNNEEHSWDLFHDPLWRGVPKALFKHRYDLYSFFNFVRHYSLWTKPCNVDKSGEGHFYERVWKRRDKHFHIRFSKIIEDPTLLAFVEYYLLLANDRFEERDPATPELKKKIRIDIDRDYSLHSDVFVDLMAIFGEHFYTMEDFRVKTGIVWVYINFTTDELRQKFQSKKNLSEMLQGQSRQVRARIGNPALYGIFTSSIM